MTSPLIGRAAALRSLKAAIGDPGCAAVTVRGPAGSGKTTLAEAALDAAQADGALVGSGKYAQGDLQSPFGPIMRAFSQAVGRALDQMHDPEPVTAAMADALGPALGVLSHTGFRADAAPPPDTSPAVIGRREGTARVIDASLRLARWLTGFEAPIVLFIDDWRRGAPGAQELLAALVSASADLRLTLLLAERDDAPLEPLDDNARIRLIEVGALGPADRLAVLETVLGEAGAAVFDWFGPTCPTLPFDLVAAARALNASGAVTPEAGGWRVDPARAASLGRADLARSLVSRLDSLSKTARRMALATAMWGDGAPSSMLRAAIGVTPDAFESALDHVSALGLLERRGEEVRYLHDRLRDAVLAAGDSDVTLLAGEMAERLARGPRPQWAQASSAALRFRQMGGVEGIDVERWRDRFAQGSLDARAAMDIEAASGFAESAWRLRQIAWPPDADADRLIIREAVLAAADRKDAAQVRARLAALFLLARGDEGVGEDYELAIAAARLVGDPALAWALARKGLARFGVTLPDQVETRHLLLSIALWRFERLFRPDKDQLVSPTRSVDALTRIASAAAMLAYERSPRAAALVAFQGSRRASRAAKGSAFWLSTDTFLCAMIGDYEQAALLGELAAAAVGLPGYNGFAHAATLNRALGWGCAWRCPAADLRPRCLEVKALAMAEGDVVQAAGAIRNWVLSGWRTAASLPILERDIRQAQEEVQRLGDSDVAASIDVILAAVTNLAGPAPREPSDDASIEVGARPGWARNIPEGGVVVTLELASAHGDWVFAQRFAEANRKFRRNLDNNPRGVDWRFHETLARLKTGQAPRRADLAVVRRAARLNPVDHRSKLLILEAEGLRARGRAVQSMEAYALAVAAAEAGSSYLVAGVAGECAAEAARASGDLFLAETYERHAQTAWSTWGALAKVRTAAIVTGENPLASELADTRARAAAADRTARARSRFLADVAHELRTPLQSMQGVLDLAADDPAQLDLAALREVFSSLKTVVNDLTDFGALSSGDAPLEARPVSIGELVRSECSVATPFAANSGASLAVEIDDDVPERVETDGPRLRQVVRNLLSNAAKYGQGGPIAVRLARSAETSTRSDALTLTVDDEGPGLSAADLLRLFEPFARGARAGDGLGLGLGLALSRRIAGRLGGALLAENRPGGGARFTLRFPLIVAQDAPEPIASTAISLRILLAEDLALVRRLIGAILTRQGHEVTEAADGAAAASLYRAHNFDLAILDLGMPGMTGLELLVLLRDTEQGHVPPPVILLTASGDEDIATAARAAGAAMVLRKPVSAEELSQAIAKLGAVRAAEESPTSRFTAEMAALKRAARVELRERIERFGDRPDGALAANGAEAHRIAGLAAQFGWPRIAAVADEIEAACLLGGAPSIDAVRQLSRALAALGPEDHASAAVLPS